MFGVYFANCLNRAIVSQIINDIKFDINESSWTKEFSLKSFGLLILRQRVLLHRLQRLSPSLRIT